MNNTKNDISEVVNTVNNSKNLFKDSPTFKPIAGALGFGALLISFGRLFKK